MRYLGIDFGTQRIGLALSDEMGWTAQPHSVLKHTSLEKDLDALAEIVRENDVGHIVIGLPRHMSGAEGEMAAMARNFADAAGQRFGLPVEFMDERLSSMAAERALIEGGVKRDKRRGVVDKVAAALILQTYLDSKG